MGNEIKGCIIIKYVSSCPRPFVIITLQGDSNVRTCSQYNVTNGGNNTFVYIFQLFGVNINVMINDNIHRRVFQNVCRVQTNRVSMMMMMMIEVDVICNLN